MFYMQQQNSAGGLTSGASSTSSESVKHRSGDVSRSRSKSQEMSGSISDETPFDVSGPTETSLSPVSELTADDRVRIH